MLETVFRTADLPADEQFDSWYQMIRNSILPAIIRAERTTEFDASIRSLDLGTVQVHLMAVPPVEVTRPWRLIRQSDPEQCHLDLMLSGNLGFAQDDRQTVLGTGDLMFYDSSRAFCGWADNPAVPGASQHIQVQFPRAVLPNPDLVDKIIGVRLPARDGLRSLLSGYLRELVRTSATYHSADSGMLATSTVDLITTLLTHELNSQGLVPPETRQRVLLAQIHDFIHQHLGDPALSPGMIAGAHHISTRYLHKLFHAEGTTVAGWIRQRRLERCHRDLADPQLFARPINAIAARWGFGDNAHFSRLFRANYGISASDYRRLVRQADVAARV